MCVSSGFLLARLNHSMFTLDAPVMQIAIEGCCHGELDKIYSTLQYLEKKENRKVDLLICCGDFQVQHRGKPG